ncbi:benzoate/H(+) symporter BenE family transporter [Amycolatopsis silviterrae]|uniref:Benzoate/H(+) symporter BenE family transporter n=1 Tax=Amycolatopsis silviterrae TaxID=1656914 RepID=A0ABW5H3J8_9PSEU
MKPQFPSPRAVAPPSAVVSAVIAVVVGTGSSAAIVFTAAKAAGASSAELASWMLALFTGMAVTGIGLSLRYRMPIVMAWSTPGAALLAVGLVGASMPQAIGAFVVSAALILISGLTGWFARIMDRIPVALAAGLLAGILLEFGTGLFSAMHGSFAVVFPMFAVYLVFRRWLARYAVLAALGVGVVAALLTDSIDLGTVDLAVAAPVFTMPDFSWQVIIGAGLPLFVVTMASQNLAGVAVLRNDGYDVPVSPVLSWTGGVNLLLAPFGCFGLNLAAITAAICTGSHAHEDRDRRFIAAVWVGIFNLCLGVFGATLGSLLTALPKALIAGIAGLGLLNTISSSLSSALADPEWREPAVVTFLATASGVTLLGIGSAFWGLLAGVLTALVTRRVRKTRQAKTPAAKA